MEFSSLKANMASSHLAVDRDLPINCKSSNTDYCHQVLFF